EPRRHLGGAALARLEGSDAVLDPLVVDLGDARGVAGTGRAQVERRALHGAKLPLRGPWRAASGATQGTLVARLAGVHAGVRHAQQLRQVDAVLGVGGDADVDPEPVAV